MTRLVGALLIGLALLLIVSSRSIPFLGSPGEGWRNEIASNQMANALIVDCHRGLSLRIAQTTGVFATEYRKYCLSLVSQLQEKVGAASGSYILRASVLIDVGQHHLAQEALLRSQEIDPNSFWLARRRLSAWQKMAGHEELCEDETVRLDLVVLQRAPERRAVSLPFVCEGADF